LATTVYDVETIKLQDGTEIELKPLTIKKLREFMKVIAKTENATTEEETMAILVEACGIPLFPQLKELENDLDKLEDKLDMPTISHILEICGGIKLDDPNLLAAAVLAGQNSI